MRGVWYVNSCPRGLPPVLHVHSIDNGDCPIFVWNHSILSLCLVPNHSYTHSKQCDDVNILSRSGWNAFAKDENALFLKIFFQRLILLRHFLRRKVLVNFLKLPAQTPTFIWNEINVYHMFVRCFWYYWQLCRDVLAMSLWSIREPSCLPNSV